MPVDFVASAVALTRQKDRHRSQFRHLGCSSVRARNPCGARIGCAGPRDCRGPNSIAINGLYLDSRSEYQAMCGVDVLSAFSAEFINVAGTFFSPVQPARRLQSRFIVHGPRGGPSRSLDLTEQVIARNVPRATLTDGLGGLYGSVTTRPGADHGPKPKVGGTDAALSFPSELARKR